jgi:hypothetical protein
MVRGAAAETGRRRVRVSGGKKSPNSTIAGTELASLYLQRKKQNHTLQALQRGLFFCLGTVRKKPMLFRADAVAQAPVTDPRASG